MSGQDAAELQGLQNSDPLHYELVMKHYDHALDKMAVTTDIDAEDTSGLGLVPLCLAANDESADAFDVVQALVRKYGADVSVADGKGMTALHYAAASGNLAVVELLVNRGADLETGPEMGEMTVTPLFMAYSRRRSRVADFLKLHGAEELDQELRENLQVQGAIAEAVARSMESMPEELSTEEVVRYQFEAMSQAAAAELEAVGNSEGASAWRGYSGRLLELIQESPLEEGASLDAWRGKIMQRAMQELQQRTNGR